MKKFKIGKTYSMRSICDQNCIWSYKVIGRTEKTITITDGEKIQKCRISKYSTKIEIVYPLGVYSMCPVLRAE